MHTDHTSYIMVKCTFAINSATPGFVLIQDEHSQYTINTALQQHLPSGEYRVTVYDQFGDYLDDNLATHYRLLIIYHFTFTSSSLYSKGEVIPVALRPMKITEIYRYNPSNKVFNWENICCYSFAISHWVISEHCGVVFCLNRSIGANLHCCCHVYTMCSIDTATKAQRRY